MDKEKADEELAEAYHAMRQSLADCETVFDVTPLLEKQNDNIKYLYSILVKKETINQRAIVNSEHEEFRILYNWTVNLAEQVCHEYWPCDEWFMEIIPLLDKFNYLIDEENLENLGSIKNFYKFSQQYYGAKNADNH